MSSRSSTSKCKTNTTTRHPKKSPSKKPKDQNSNRKTPKHPRFVLFTQHHPSEVVLEVAHNVLQKEDPYPCELERMVTRLDNVPLFDRPVMPQLSIAKWRDNGGEYDFHILNLILADHFSIPFYPFDDRCHGPLEPPPRTINSFPTPSTPSL